MSTLLADLRYALRQLRRGPGFAVTAILTLALGVAANVVVFGIIDALLLKPLPVAHPEQLSFLQHREDAATERLHRRPSLPTRTGVRLPAWQIPRT